MSFLAKSLQVGECVHSVLGVAKSPYVGESAHCVLLATPFRANFFGANFRSSSRHTDAKRIASEIDIGPRTVKADVPSAPFQISLSRT